MFDGVLRGVRVLHVLRGARVGTDDSGMFHKPNTRMLAVVAFVAGSVITSGAIAGPVTSVSMQGWITFSGVTESDTPAPRGLDGISVHGSWNPSPLVISGDRTESFARFDSDWAPPPPNDCGPREGDAWGLGMAAAVHLIEAGSASGQASHSMFLSLTDMTYGQSVYTVTGVVDLWLTGQVNVQDTDQQSAQTLITLDAYAGRVDDAHKIAGMGTIMLDAAGTRVTTRSVSAPFTIQIGGMPGVEHGRFAGIWIDMNVSTSLLSVPAPGALTCALLGLSAIVSRRRR